LESFKNTSLRDTLPIIRIWNKFEIVLGDGAVICGNGTSWTLHIFITMVSFDIFLWMACYPVVDNWNVKTCIKITSLYHLIIIGSSKHMFWHGNANKLKHPGRIMLYYLSKKKKVLYCCTARSIPLIRQI
jgi:hypothetical protein